MTTNMRLEDKVSVIRELITKAKSNNEYSTRIMLPEDMSIEEFINRASALVDNATELLKPNRVENLREDEYAEAYATIQSLLDGVLTKFPEYRPSEAVRHM